MTPKEKLHNYMTAGRAQRPSRDAAISLLSAFQFEPKAKNPNHYSHPVQTGVTVELPKTGDLNHEQRKAVIAACQTIQQIPAAERHSSVEELSTTVTLTYDSKFPELHTVLTFMPKDRPEDRDRIRADAQKAGEAIVSEHQKSLDFYLKLYRVQASRSNGTLLLNARECENLSTTFEYKDHKVTPEMVMKFVDSFAEHVATVLEERKGTYSQLLAEYEARAIKYPSCPKPFINKQGPVPTIADPLFDKIITLETFGHSYPTMRTIEQLQEAISAIDEFDKAFKEKNFVAKEATRKPPAPVFFPQPSSKVIIVSTNASAPIMEVKDRLLARFRGATGILDDDERLLTELHKKLEIRDTKASLLREYIDPKDTSTPGGKASEVAILRKKLKTAIAEYWGNEYGKKDAVNAVHNDFSILAEARLLKSATSSQMMK